jgi:hypothetical protein
MDEERTALFHVQQIMRLNFSASHVMVILPCTSTKRAPMSNRFQFRALRDVSFVIALATL